MIEYLRDPVFWLLAIPAAIIWTAILLMHSKDRATDDATHEKIGRRSAAQQSKRQYTPPPRRK